LFPDEKFQTIFSNIFYWIPKLRQLLQESKRILKSSGRIIILVPDKKLKQNLIYNQYIESGEKWAKI
jgi:ubiquinone/menaquinone biosynthesis C-methylase UbiE